MNRLPLLLAVVCFGASASAADTAFSLTRDFPNCKLERPVALAIPADGSQRVFLAQQTGKVLLLPKDSATAETKVFLDVSGLMKVENDFEEGLVGFAFHPKFKENGRFYVCYAQQQPKINRLSEFRVSASDPDKADPASERVVLEVLRPYWNHNCGNMVFGPDGMLYFGIGDGGKGDDAARLAQNLFALNGKILRLDVDTRTGRRGYGIPKDNPFVKTDGASPEIWTWGHRNPWGMAFDSATGELWCAEVGQELREEINIITRGQNYGWSFREGTIPFVRRKDAPPEGSKFTEPVFEYDRSQGLSITGGFVYHGSKHPDLQGAYIYGDWGTGRIWALKTSGPDHKVVSNTLLIEPADLKTKFPKPTAFCEDASREILVLDWNGGIHRLEKR
jgi:glucose/arabinose dehydrogenase